MCHAARPCGKCGLMGRTAVGRERLICWWMIYLRLLVRRISGLLSMDFSHSVPRPQRPEDGPPRTRSSFAACSPPGGRGEMVQCDSVVGLRCCLGAIQMVAMDFSDSVPAVTSSSHPLRSPGWVPGFRAELELHEAGTAWTTCATQGWCLVGQMATALCCCASHVFV